MVHMRCGNGELLGSNDAESVSNTNPPVKDQADIWSVRETST